MIGKQVTANDLDGSIRVIKSELLTDDYDLMWSDQTVDAIQFISNWAVAVFITIIIIVPVAFVSERFNFFDFALKSKRISNNKKGEKKYIE